MVVLCFWPHFISRYCVHTGHFLVPRSQEQADSIRAAGMRFLRYPIHLLKVSSRRLELSLTALGIVNSKNCLKFVCICSFTSLSSVFVRPTLVKRGH